ncbi:hypothetical protein T11_10670 [Trichinella zimbabwensis]|uniref:CCHC-type domain-containing protein n=1 Tax=Trichinella zimbabwensis TaxID=268475 RepID=A0A0V1HU00_9BILA|nr:hypothetical protein T11_10670 [Trichinella zimbabwensis]
MASAAKIRSKKLAANKDRLNRLLAELEKLCVGSADVYEIEEQISMTEEIYRASDALQAELELDLEGEERKVLEFPTFCAQFEASIHNRIDLDAATKFTYLISSTVGMARSSIEGIPLTKANYPQAVGILKARFGRPRLVVSEHLEALWKAPACCEMSMRGIQSLVYEVTKHLRCLAALDKDPFAGPLPLNEDNLQKFLEFAQWQANLLAKPMEEDMGKQVGKTEHRTSPKKPSRSTWKSGGRVTSSAAALAVAATGSCPFCEGEHKGADYQKRTKANLPSRMAMVRAKGVCFKCLEAGHQVRDCRESRPCAVDGCGRAHHKLLHSSTPRESARSTESSSVQRGMLAKGNGKGACLQIVRAHAYGPDGTHVAVNCLLNTGAQVSFIRKDIAEALGFTGSYKKKGGILTGSRQQRGSTGVETLRRSVGYSPDLWKDPPRQELLAERQGRRHRSDGNWATKAAADTRRTDWCRSLLRFRHGPYEKKRDRPGCAGNATWLGDLWKTDGEMVAPLEKQLPRLAATTLQVEKRRDWPGDQRPGVGTRRQSSPNTLHCGGGDPAIPRSRWSEPGRSDPHFHSRNHPACR